MKAKCEICGMVKKGCQKVIEYHPFGLTFMKRQYELYGSHHVPGAREPITEKNAHELYARIKEVRDRVEGGCVCRKCFNYEKSRYENGVDASVLVVETLGTVNNSWFPELPLTPGGSICQKKN